MKTYLSFGCGVNSVALALHEIDNRRYPEMVFSDTGCEWPETYAYLELFNNYLIENGLRPVTVLTPNVQGYSSLYDYCLWKEIIPSRVFRDCTDKFKVSVKMKYFERPAFNLIAFDFSEAHRAKLRSIKNIEDRFPLIEAEIDRNGCMEIIKSHGLPLPPKSACYICFNSKHSDWRKLRNEHPDLYCKAQTLENRCNERRTEKGLKEIYLSKYDVPLDVEVEENQLRLFERDEYPPCQCGL